MYCILVYFIYKLTPYEIQCTQGPLSAVTSTLSRTLNINYHTQCRTQHVQNTTYWPHRRPVERFTLSLQKTALGILMSWFFFVFVALLNRTKSNLRITKDDVIERDACLEDLGRLSFWCRQFKTLKCWGIPKFWAHKGKSTWYLMI